ncbi:hypothetical protein F5X99DRAFT_370808 [Biscogniauxia marginata]|nr:hypothetical protein F5X99DRAFT_370808 [Biscogniauxia marginata]
MNYLFSNRAVSLLSTIVVRHNRRNSPSFKANSQTCSTTRGYRDIPRMKATTDELDLDTFRQDFWIPELPLALYSFHSFPAARKWFTHESQSSQVSFAEHMEDHGNAILSYEYMSSVAPNGATLDPQLKNLQDFQEWLQTSNQKERHHLPRIIDYLIQSGKDDRPRFQQFDAPLSLLIRACQFNHTRSNPSDRIQKLYVAQSNLDHLPEALSQDLPAPRLINDAGKGDIYDSSIWLGLEPTYTPLHRDPNPNLFCQVLGSKIIHLIRPKLGSDLFVHVRRKLGYMGSSRFRGTEMMEGPERELLHHAVWTDESHSENIERVSVGPGDALFIPKGWWHSVASTGDKAELNVSVNWWFR